MFSFLGTTFLKSGPNKPSSAGMNPERTEGRTRTIIRESRANTVQKINPLYGGLDYYFDMANSSNISQRMRSSGVTPGSEVIYHQQLQDMEANMLKLKLMLEHERNRAIAASEKCEIAVSELSNLKQDMMREIQKRQEAEQALRETAVDRERSLEQISVAREVARRAESERDCALLASHQEELARQALHRQHVQALELLRASQEEVKSLAHNLNQSEAYRDTLLMRIHRLEGEGRRTSEKLSTCMRENDTLHKELRQMHKKLAEAQFGRAIEYAHAQNSNHYQ